MSTAKHLRYNISPLLNDKWNLFHHWEKHVSILQNCKTYFAEQEVLVHFPSGKEWSSSQRNKSAWSHGNAWCFKKTLEFKHHQSSELQWRQTKQISEKLWGQILPLFYVQKSWESSITTVSNSSLENISFKRVSYLMIFCGTLMHKPNLIILLNKILLSLRSC